MRTTLTIDGDVAADLRRLQRSDDRTFKEIVNDALRRGLRDMDQPAKSAQRFRVKPMDLGACRVANVDDIAETLAVAEGEAFH